MTRTYMTAEDIGWTNPPTKCQGRAKDPNYVNGTSLSGQMIRCPKAPTTWDGYDASWYCDGHARGAEKRRANEDRKATR